MNTVSSSNNTPTEFQNQLQKLFSWKFILSVTLLFGGTLFLTRFLPFNRNGALLTGLFVFIFFICLALSNIKILFHFKDKTQSFDKITFFLFLLISIFGMAPLIFLTNLILYIKPPFLEKWISYLQELLWNMIMVPVSILSPYLPMDAIFSIGYVLLLLSFYIPLFILGLKWILKRNLFSAKNNRELPFSKKALGLSLKILLILIYAVPSLEWIFLSALFFSLGFFSIFPMEYYQNWGWFLHSCLMN